MSLPAQRPMRKAPSLWPREYGAYVQLLAPLLTSLLFVPPTLAAAALASSACALFVAHEPVLVLLGRRGERARSLLEGPALRWLLLCVSIASLTFVFGLGAAHAATRPVLAVPAVFALVATAIVLLHREQEAWGELWVGVTLASFSLPVLVASGLAPQRAAELTLGWIVVHWLSTLTARGFVYRKRDGGRLLIRMSVGSAVLVAAAGLLAIARLIPLAWALAALPIAALAAATALGAFRPRTPKTLGWSLAAANLAALVLFGLGLRGVM